MSCSTNWWITCSPSSYIRCIPARSMIVNTEFHISIRWHLLNMLSNKYNFFLRYCPILSAGNILKGYNFLYFTESTKQRPFWEVNGYKLFTKPDVAPPRWYSPLMIPSVSHINQSTTSHPISRSVLILSSNPHLGCINAAFRLKFYKPSSSFPVQLLAMSPWFNRPNRIWWTARIMK